MLFAAFLLLCPFPQGVDTPQAVPDSPAVAVVASSSVQVPSLSSALPSAPEPKWNVHDEIASTAPAERAGEGATSAEPIKPRVEALPPAKPALSRIYERPAQRKAWYALAIASHSAAAFDAWSTRRALSNGYGTEANPLLRPFAHSGALYVATQVSPVFMDYLGRKMIVSQRRWVRRIWWLPQTAGTGLSLSAGAHNVGVVP
jgi:hypothetical protein